MSNINNVAYNHFIADLDYLTEINKPLTLDTFCSTLIHTYGSFTDFKDISFNEIVNAICDICVGMIPVSFEVFWYCIDKGADPCIKNNAIFEYVVFRTEYEHSYPFMEYLLSKGVSINQTYKWKEIFSLLIDGIQQKRVTTLLDFLINNKHLINIDWENNFLYECACEFEKNTVKSWIKKQIKNK